MSREVQDSSSANHESTIRLLRKSPCRKKRKLQRLANGNFLQQMVRETIYENEVSESLSTPSVVTQLFSQPAVVNVVTSSSSSLVSPAIERSSPDTTFSSSQHTPDPCLLDDPKDKLFFLPDDDEVEDDETEETSFDDDKSILDVVSEDTIIRGPDQHQSGSTDADMTKNDDCEEREMLSSEGDGKKKKSSKSPPLPCSPGYLVKDGITVELLGQGLWKRFYKLGTEMIITKAGRRMFPTLKVRVHGLDPHKNYLLALEIVPFDDKRYRYVYHSSQWMIAGAGDPPPPSASGGATVNTFLHGDSPSSGEFWQSQSLISFDKLKLTNNRASIMQGQTCLHSMHKYLPRIHIKEIDENAPVFEGARVTTDLLEKNLDEIVSEGTLTFTFPETAFTTVTAYQNQQITKLKIASNPFAKGFRESTRSRDHHNSFSHLPSPFYTQHAASMHFHPHHPGPHPHTPPTQFLHPRQLLEANQQIQMATQQLQLLAPVLQQTMRFQPRQISGLSQSWQNHQQPPPAPSQR